MTTRTTPLRFLLILALATTCACAQQAPDRIFPGEDWVEATPESQGVDSAGLERAMQALESIGQDGKDGTPHAGTKRTVVIRNGRMIWKGAEVDEVQLIYSCTKSVTSSVFGLLVDRGACSPSTRAADIYPALEDHYPHVLLGHFSSLTSGYSIRHRQPWQELQPADFVPGSKMHYNPQMHLLSYLLQRRTGERTSEIWRKGVAEKIGIPRESWNWESAGEIEGAEIDGGGTGLHISARQLARFGHLYISKGLWNGERVLSENWVELSTTPQVGAHTPCHQGGNAWYNVLPGRYGYGWWLNGIGSDGQRFWPHAPDGTYFAQGNLNNHLIIVPEWNLVLVHLDRGQAIDSRLYDKVFAALSLAMTD